MFVGLINSALMYYSREKSTFTAKKNKEKKRKKNAMRKHRKLGIQTPPWCRNSYCIFFAKYGNFVGFFLAANNTHAS